jgi:hypothetical protein
MKALFTLVLSLIAMAAVFADSPHFVRGPTASFDATTGDYCVSFVEAGLGNLPITYTLTAGTADFTFQCFTRSNNTPQGDPNGVSFSNLTTQTTITPHNGRIRGTICLEPAGEGRCQGKGLVNRLIEALYTNLTFCDSSNGICQSVPDLGGGVQQ